jgi:EAL domain-containing protein (putative c-di-GMP-specific phosphodiesterase class I)
MKRNRCDEVQGYYFSGPVEADTFARMVREDRRLQ